MNSIKKISKNIFDIHLIKRFILILVIYKFFKYLFYFFYNPSYYFNKLNQLFDISEKKYFSDYFPFEGPSYLFNFITSIYVIIGIVCLCIFIFLLKKYTNISFSPLLSWHTLKSDNKYIYYFLNIISGVILWKLLSFEYNFYYDSAFIVDRLIYIVLWGVSLRVPLFLIIFTFLTLVNLAQVHIPGLYNFGMVDSLIFWEILVLWSSFQIATCFIKIRSYLYLLILMSLHLSYYFYAGIAKLAISPNGYEYFLTDFKIMFKQALIYGNKFMELAYSFFNRIEPILPFSIVVLELSALIVLFSKRLTYSLLSLFSLMHILIFLICRMIFWKWILVNISLCALIYKLKKTDLDALYKKSSIATCIVLILFAPLTYKPIWLGWYQTNIINAKTVEVTNNNGEVFEVSLRDFGIHSIYTTFFIQHLYFLDDKPPPKFSVGEYKEYIDLTSMSLEQYKSYREQEKWLDADSAINLEKKEILEDFFKQYFHNKNNYAGRKKFFMPIWGHIYQDYDQLKDKYRKSLSEIEVVKNVKIRYREFFINIKNTDFTMIEDKYILDVNIPI
ncbi:hypothetical protein DID74_00325 [Candidatus Marinamargulisbacteria bacterium SCGC AG-333-B06]|nr:hypothetical protein DID74_00325 [Candidatus Marinamargulisbacteria bacterium SCGC AG-333-B06]